MTDGPQARVIEATQLLNHRQADGDGRSFVLCTMTRPIGPSSAKSRCSGWRGGNASIGRLLYPLLIQAGLDAVQVSPRLVYVDANRPDLVDGFIRKTFTAMIAGVRASAIEAGITSPDAFDAGVRDLYRTAEADGVFCYTFFKGVGAKRRHAEPGR